MKSSIFSFFLLPLRFRSVGDVFATWGKIRIPTRQKKGRFGRVVVVGGRTNSTLVQLIVCEIWGGRAESQAGGQTRTRRRYVAERAAEPDHPPSCVFRVLSTRGGSSFRAPVAVFVFVVVVVGRRRRYRANSTLQNSDAGIGSRVPVVNVPSGLLLLSIATGSCARRFVYPQSTLRIAAAGVHGPPLCYNVNSMPPPPTRPQFIAVKTDRVSYISGW